MHAHRPWVLAIGAALALAAAFFLFDPRQRAPAPAAISVAQAPAARAVEASQDEGSSAAGLLGVYDLSYALHFEGPGGATDYDLAAKLDVVRAAGDADVRIALISEAKGGFTGANIDGTSAEKPSEAFSRPWRLHIAKNGALGRAEFASETPQMVRAMLEQIAAIAQLAQPSDLAALSWTNEERDNNGAYVVRYERRGVFEYRKTWAQRAMVVGEDEVFGANGQATLGASDKAIESLDATVTQRFRMSARVDREMKGTIRLSLTRRKEDSARALAAVGELQKETGYEPVDLSLLPKASDADRDRQRVAGRSFERIVSDIERADAAGAWQLRKSFGFDLASLIRLDPTVVPKTVSSIGTATAEPVRRTLIESLANASSKPAQKGLVALMGNDQLPFETRGAARSVSAFVTEPTEELLETLDKDSFSPEPLVRGQAIIALANLLRDNDEAAQAKARLTTFIRRGVKVLEDNAIVAKNPQAEPVNQPTIIHRNEALRWIRALGATHSNDALPFLRDASRHPDRLVRAQTVLALGKLEDPANEDVRSLLVERVAQDKDFLVRHHAITTIGEIGPKATLEITKQALFSDVEPTVRAQAAFVIGSWANEAPELKTLLDEALKTETDRVVLETILDMTVPKRGMREAVKKVAVRSAL